MMLQRLVACAAAVIGLSAASIAATIRAVRVQPSEARHA